MGTATDKDWAVALCKSQAGWSAIMGCLWALLRAQGDFGRRSSSLSPMQGTLFYKEKYKNNGSRSLDLPPSNEREF